ncbi:hypothetical protein FJY63_02560, partial [Candidatus Sumerlaeota bacterium]|nr:hypothetical protein [Candidatus Sumerlaeota bacterium]
MDSKRLRRLRFDAAIVATDMFAVALALPCAYLLRFYTFLPPRGGWESEHYLRIYPIAVAAWVISLAAVRAYE